MIVIMDDRTKLLLYNVALIYLAENYMNHQPITYMEFSKQLKEFSATLDGHVFIMWEDIKDG